MTSEVATKNVESLRRALDAVWRGDRDEFEAELIETVRPDCTWSPIITGVEGHTYRGPAGILAWYDDLSSAFDLRWEKREFRPIGDGVVLFLCTLEMQGHESGLEMSQEIGVVYEFEGGKLHRGRAYSNPVEAVSEAEAIGA